MIARKLMTISAAAALAVAPTVAYSASPVSVASSARTGAAMDGASQQIGRSTQITLGFLVLLALLIVVLAGDDDGPNNPVSP